MKLLLVGLVGVSVAGCCSDPAMRDDALRRRQYELAEREARLRRAEAKFKECVTARYPGQEPGLEPPPPTAAGPAETEIGGGTIGPEQLEEIRRAERVGQPTLVECYEEEMERRKTKTLEGKVVVKILIGTEGAAQQVVIGQSTLKAPKAEGCMANAIRTWEFPRLNTPSWYSTTFSFSPAY